MEIRNGERRAATPGLNPASCEATSMMQRGGRSAQAVTQVKGLSSVKLEIMEADLLRNEGRQHDAHRQGERGVTPAESMTTAWEQKRDDRDLGVQLNIEAPPTERGGNSLGQPTANDSALYSTFVTVGSGRKHAPRG